MLLIGPIMLMMALNPLSTTCGILKNDLHSMKSKSQRVANDHIMLKRSPFWMRSRIKKNSEGRKRQTGHTELIIGFHVREVSYITSLINKIRNTKMHSAHDRTIEEVCEEAAAKLCKSCTCEVMGPLGRSFKIDVYYNNEPYPFKDRPIKRSIRSALDREGPLVIGNGSTIEVDPGIIIGYLKLHFVQALSASQENMQLSEDTKGSIKGYIQEEMRGFGFQFRVHRLNIEFLLIEVRQSTDLQQGQTWTEFQTVVADKLRVPFKLSLSRDSNVYINSYSFPETDEIRVGSNKYGDKHDYTITTMPQYENWLTSPDGGYGSDDPSMIGQAKIYFKTSLSDDQVGLSLDGYSRRRVVKIVETAIRGERPRLQFKILRQIWNHQGFLPINLFVPNYFHHGRVKRTPSTKLLKRIQESIEKEVEKNPIQLTLTDGSKLTIAGADPIVKNLENFYKDLHIAMYIMIVYSTFIILLIIGFLCRNKLPQITTVKDVFDSPTSAPRKAK